MKIQIRGNFLEQNFSYNFILYQLWIHLKHNKTLFFLGLFSEFKFNIFIVDLYRDPDHAFSRTVFTCRKDLQPGKTEDDLSLSPAIISPAVRRAGEARRGATPGVGERRAQVAAAAAHDAAVRVQHAAAQEARHPAIFAT